MFKVNKKADVNGTYLNGYICASYDELVTLFGTPCKSDGYKSSGEWRFVDDNGKAAYTIYDWKSTRLYDNDQTLPTVKEFRQLKNQIFNIGGRGNIEYFQYWLCRQLSELRNK